MNEIFNLDDMLKEKESDKEEKKKSASEEITLHNKHTEEPEEDTIYWVPFMYAIFDYRYIEASSPEEALADIKYFIENEFCEHEGYIASPIYFKEGITKSRSQAHDYIHKIAKEKDFEIIG